MSIQWRPLIAKTFIVFSAAGTALAQPAAAPPVYRGRIVGVFDERTGEPVTGVEVRNILNGISALTSSTGTVALSFVDTSGGMLSFKKLGYQPLTLVVANSVRDTTPLTVVMRSAVQALPTVVTNAKGDDRVSYVSPALQGFEDRRHQGLGHFVPDAELRKHDARQLSDIVERYIPGVQLTSPPKVGSSARYLISLRAPGVACYVTIYVDGALFYSKTASAGLPPDMRSLDVSQYAGVEFYASGSTAPPQFNGTDSGCGLLLLWTREKF